MVLRLAEAVHGGGRPCIRHLRIRVKDVLEMLAAGVSHTSKALNPACRK
ncbi:MAG: DUF433 domain-containing protein [Betaproteobacteria bacterium]|nr:DUF433 domain-containing protein [Betaproteobacteria bacterium]